MTFSIQPGSDQPINIRIIGWSDPNRPNELSIDQGGQAVSRQKVENTNNALKIDVDVKVGILHTVAKAIYATPVGKIREAVSNAKDNEASWIVIVADQITNTLCIFDNGHGIKEDQFKTIFKSIGYGLLSTDPKTKLSYFGLGLMSIFQLGERIKIFTRPRGEKETHLLEVDSKSIFDRSDKEKDASISTLKDLITLSKAKGKRGESEAPFLDDILDEKVGGIPTCFTEIVIENVEKGDLNEICHSKFVDELRKALPLKVDPDEPFLKAFVGGKRNKIKSLLENDEFCPTIDVFFGVREMETEIASDESSKNGANDNESVIYPKDEDIRQLWKYFPKFRSDLEFPDDNVWVSNDSGNDFAYYIVHTVAKDLYRNDDSNREVGFWVRNQNFLVKAADFLEKPGSGKNIIQVPLRNWIFGEIFHKNMNPFLTVSRTDYLFEDQLFLDFREKIFQVVRPLNKLLRDIYNEQKKIIDRVVTPFAKIGETGGTIANAEQRLRNLIGEDIDEKEFHDDMLKRLNEQRVPQIEDENARVDFILREKQEPVPLVEEDNLYVQLDPTLRDIEEYYQVSWDDRIKKVILSLSPNLFAPKKVRFLFESFEVVYVVKLEEDPGVSVNVDNKKIYVNPFNKELSRYSVSILDIVIAMEVAYALSNTREDLKKNFLSMIGAKPTRVDEYILPLGDDLRATLKLSSLGG